MTATQLAERFEVSRRAILRDVDTLCQAGLPLVTLPGSGGGISLLPGSRFEKNMMSGQELQQVVDGLGALQSVSSNDALGSLIRKLGHTGGDESIAIDLGDYPKENISKKIDMLRHAAQVKKQVRFYYYSSSGEANRLVEPYRVFFQWSAWCLQAWCLERGDFRMFKLGRMCDLREETTDFVAREIPSQSELVEQVYQDDYPVEILFSPDMAYKIVEMFGPGSYEQLPDGNLTNGSGNKAASLTINPEASVCYHRGGIMLYWWALMQLPGKGIYVQHFGKTGCRSFSRARMILSFACWHLKRSISHFGLGQGKQNVKSLIY